MKPATQANSASYRQRNGQCVPARGRGQWSAAGKVTVGLSSHRTCVTDCVVYPSTGSTASEGEIEACTPPTLLCSTAPFCTFWVFCTQFICPLLSDTVCFCLSVCLFILLFLLPLLVNKEMNTYLTFYSRQSNERLSAVYIFVLYIYISYRSLQISEINVINCLSNLVL